MVHPEWIQIITVLITGKLGLYNGIRELWYDKNNVQLKFRKPILLARFLYLFAPSESLIQIKQEEYFKKYGKPLKITSELTTRKSVSVIFCFLFIVFTFLPDYPYLSQLFKNTPQIPPISNAQS